MNRLRTATSATLLAMTLFGASLHAADTSEDIDLKPEEASIQFLNQRSIIDWHADGDMGLWVQDRRRQWYYAKLITPCRGLEFATTLVFQTRSSNTFDRFSSVVIPNQAYGAPCALSSLTHSDAPPGRKDRRRTTVGPRAG